MGPGPGQVLGSRARAKARARMDLPHIGVLITLMFEHEKLQVYGI